MDGGLIKARRSRLSIKMHILKICEHGECRTGIFFSSRISYSSCMKYVKELKELGFLACSEENESKHGAEFCTTLEGMKLYNIYERIAKHIVECENG